MKILHILTDSNIGGAGRLLYNLSSCIDRKKFDLVFIFAQGSSLIELFSPFNFKIYTIKGTDKSFDIKSISEIKEIIKKEAPDIVHSHSSLSGRIAARLEGIPKKRNVYTKHCVFGVSGIMRSLPVRIIYRAIDDLLSSSVIAVADAAKDELIKHGVRRDKIKVIINGSNPLKRITEGEKQIIRGKLGIKKGEWVVGISARLEKYKGHEYFLKAAELAQKNGENIRFIIMGDGSYRPYLEKQASKLKLLKNGTVIFLGFVEDVYMYMNIFDINVNCSTGTETSSLSISEGLSIGLPTIVSDFGGNPNMVKNGLTGYVIKQASPNDLYNAIIRLKKDNELYQKMKNNALKDFWSRFSSLKMTKQYEKFYCNLSSK